MLHSRGVEVNYQRDYDGLITRAGASWEEERPQTVSFLLSCVIASVMALLFGLAAPPLLALGFVGLLTSIWMLVSIRGPQRGLYFDDDGRIQVPFGLYDYRKAGHIKWHVDDVASIEARMQHPQPKGESERLFEVILVSFDGGLITLSRNLREETALKAAAQLTKALQQLRRDHGASVEFSGAWGSAG